MSTGLGSGRQFSEALWKVCGYLCFRAAWFRIGTDTVRKCPGIPKCHAGMETRGRFASRDRLSSMERSSIVFPTAEGLMIPICQVAIIAAPAAELYTRSVATWGHVPAAGARPLLAIVSMRMIRRAAEDWSFE